MRFHGKVTIWKKCVQAHKVARPAIYVSHIDRGSRTFNCFVSEMGHWKQCVEKHNFTHFFLIIINLRARKGGQRMCRNVPISSFYVWHVLIWRVWGLFIETKKIFIWVYDITAIFKLVPLLIKLSHVYTNNTAVCVDRLKTQWSWFK